jgi:hypothetical protein
MEWTCYYLAAARSLPRVNIIWKYLPKTKQITKLDERRPWRQLTFCTV